MAISLVLLCCLLGAQLDAQAPPKAPPVEKPGPGNLDDQLLNDLKPAGPQNPPARKVVEGDPPDATPGKPALDGEDLGSRVDSRLVEAGQRMRQVESRLRQGDASVRTRLLQDQITTLLSQIIDEQQQQQSGASSSATQPRPSEPPAPDERGNSPASEQNAASQARGTAAPPASDAEMVQAGQSVWGMLPDRLRQSVLSLGNEEFLPQYAELIRQYYERLAERGKKKP